MSEAKKLTRKDFVSDQEVRWCPGCGDYAILAAVQKVMPTLGIPRENIVFVSGIGCSSRFPYYMETYGFHTIHGRAPAIATGLKLANPELSVWVVTGDGDGLSIGASHLLHALRRNVDVKILLFNNRIYGLTKGQFSPTSELGKRTASTPYGSVDYPFDPLSVAIGVEASFVARATDVDIKLLGDVLTRAAAHKGSAFVEIYQNCNIFNDGAFDSIRGKDVKADAQLELEHGKPLIFGADRDKGIRLNAQGAPEVVRLGDGITEADLLVHDEAFSNPAYAFTLSRMGREDGLPTPVGVLRAVSRPSYAASMYAQLETVAAQRGKADLGKLLRSGQTWTQA
ncbi:MAG: 2-oxoglutarate ferredoxin oxidoreductase subunit beta [Myxococcales bacterium]